MRSDSINIYIINICIYYHIIDQSHKLKFNLTNKKNQFYKNFVIKLVSVL